MAADPRAIAVLEARAALRHAHAVRRAAEVQVVQLQALVTRLEAGR